MARPSRFSALDVEKVAKALAQENLQVTPYRIQRRLGGGSIAWIEQACTELGLDLSKLGLPDGVDPDVLKALNLLQPLLNQFRAEAQHDLAAAEAAHTKTAQHHQETVERLTMARDGALRENAELRAQLEARDTALAAAHQVSEARLVQIRALESEGQAATGAIEKREAQLADAKALNDNLRDNLSHLQDSAKAQLENLRQAHAGEVSALRMQVKALDDQVIELRESATQLNRQNAELVADKRSLQSRGRDLERAVAAAERKASDAEQALARVTTRMEEAVSQAQERIEVLQTEHGKTAGNLTALAGAAWAELDGLPPKTVPKPRQRLETLLKTLAPAGAF